MGSYRQSFRRVRGLNVRRFALVTLGTLGTLGVAALFPLFMVSAAHADEIKVLSGGAA